jgi:hypothetical protein
VPSGKICTSIISVPSAQRSIRAHAISGQTKKRGVQAKGWRGRAILGEALRVSSTNETYGSITTSMRRVILTPQTVHFQPALRMHNPTQLFATHTKRLALNNTAQPLTILSFSVLLPVWAVVRAEGRAGDSACAQEKCSNQSSAGDRCTGGCAQARTT